MTEETRPCIICDKQLECAVQSWNSSQPYGGGELIFSFSYGSLKFDDHCGGTEFRALICDECAQTYKNKIEQPNETQKVFKDIAVGDCFLIQAGFFEKTDMRMAECLLSNTYCEQSVFEFDLFMKVSDIDQMSIENITEFELETSENILIC